MKTKLWLSVPVRPPIPSNYPLFTSDLRTRLTIIGSQNVTVLCGDFNLDLLRIETDTNLCGFFDTMHSFGYVHTIVC